jgi:hypothetical protein
VLGTDLLRSRILEQELQELKSQMIAVRKSNVEPARETGVVQTVVAEPPEPAKTETGSSIDFYGFVMLDAGYQNGTNDPAWFDVLRPTKLPAFSGEFAPNGKTFWGVRQTRFGVKTLTPTVLGNLKTVFEFDCLERAWMPDRRHSAGVRPMENSATSAQGRPIARS